MIGTDNACINRNVISAKCIRRYATANAKIFLQERINSFSNQSKNSKKDKQDSQNQKNTQKLTETI